MEINYRFEPRQKSFNGPTAIQMLFYKDSKRFCYSIGKKLHPNLWDYDNQRPTKSKKLIKEWTKEYPQLKTQIQNVGSRIDKVIRLCNSWFANIELTNQQIELSELKKYLNSNLKVTYSKNVENTKTDLIYIDKVLKDFVKEISNGNKLTNKKTRYALGTIKVYRTLSKAFEEVQDHYKVRFTIEDVNKELSEKWTKYLFKKKKSSRSNVGKQHKHFKKVISDKLKEVQIENYEREKTEQTPRLTISQIHRIKIGLESFQNITSESTQVYLSEKELNKLSNLKKLDSHLEIARDVFLCGCYTGLRYSDYSRLNKDFIKSKFIEIITAKTKNKVKIPIRPELKKILKKYKNNLPKTYEQKMNKYIKELCKKAGIDEPIQKTQSIGGMEVQSIAPKYELVTTHTARRTALTLMYKSGESVKDIMFISGHKTLKSFETYLRITQEESVLRMEKSKFFKGNLKIV